MPNRLLTILLTLFLLPATGTAGEFGLSQYRDESRPLLLFSPNDKHPDYRTMIEAINENIDAFNDRDMVLIHVFRNIGAEGNTLLGSEDVEHLRERYQADPEDFKLVLVGKDGDIKQESNTASRLQDIYDLIDGMPMRRQEMREND